MSAALGNLGLFLQQIMKQTDTKKHGIPPTPGTPPIRPRGTLLTGVDIPVQPRKTLLGS